MAKIRLGAGTLDMLVLRVLSRGDATLGITKS